MKISFEAARKNAGLTQAQACEKLGVSKPTLSSYESGKPEPRLGIILKMSEIYGCEINDLKEVSGE